MLPADCNKCGLSLGRKVCFQMPTGVPMVIRDDRNILHSHFERVLFLLGAAKDCLMFFSPSSITRACASYSFHRIMDTHVVSFELFVIHS